MPEYVELLSSHLVVKHWLDDMQKLSGKTPIWRTLHVDTTIPEDDRKFSAPDVRAQDSFQIPLEAPAALVLKVEPSFKLRRGKTDTQTLIYPPVPTLRESRPRLLEVQFHPRNIILRFMIELPVPRSCGCVQMLTHMVCQIYTGDEFDCICTVPKDLRSKLALGLGFTVRMPGMEFGHEICSCISVSRLAVFCKCSADLISTQKCSSIQVTYWLTRDGLGILPYNIYSDFEKELERVAWWATQRRGMRRVDRYSTANLAMKVIRAANTIFSGVGVYTVSELFYMAGLAPDLTEGEVFDNPSRFARLMEAYYSYAAKAHMDIWKYIRPYLGGATHWLSKTSTVHGMLAGSMSMPSPGHACLSAERPVYRTKCMSHLVPKKDDTYTTHQDLIASTDHLNRRHYTGYFDPFEPTYLRLGLSKPHNLGALIFSKGVWSRWVGPTQEPSGELLPRNLLLDVTFAPRTTYLHANMVSDSKVVAEHYAISGAYLNGGVFIDSLVELVRRGGICGFTWVARTRRMSGLLTPLGKRTYFRRIPDSAKKVKTFDYIVNYTNQYAVGPLDFDGIGRLICRTDPLVPHYIAMRHAVHLREDPEKRKAAQKSLKQQDLKGNSDTSKAPKKKRKVSTNHVAASMPAQAVDRPAKRRRVCTDMRIAAAGIEVQERPRRLRSGAV
ncbi:MULE domain-containing protein [Salix suchowensis]|nr:MULE domain-containing protein [Salix suchowensis]